VYVRVCINGKSLNKSRLEDADDYDSESVKVAEYEFRQWIKRSQPPPSSSRSVSHFSSCW
jgi:hypothetical protein